MIPPIGLRRAALQGLAITPLLLAWTQARQLVEGRMALHMLLELPLLLAAGWAVSALLAQRLPLARSYDRMDAQGLFGTTIVSCVSLFWMLPAALDLSILSDAGHACKMSSWWLAGIALHRSWPRLANESIAFFVGNLSWMLATAGLLYQSSETRLCVNYLLDDQASAGRALVAMAIGLGACALFQLTRNGKARRTDASARGGPQLQGCESRAKGGDSA